MQVGDLIKYIGRDGSAHYGIVTEIDSRTHGPVQALLQCASYTMWFQRRALEVVNEGR